MSDLPAQLIRARASAGLITPFVERGVAFGMSYGLGPAGYDCRIAQRRRLRPGETCLASTIEHFDMPADLVAEVCNKSSWARRFLWQSYTRIEPGWRGFLTLELENRSDGIIEIAAGSPIAQIVFRLLLEPTEQPYCGKYQDQSALPVAARFEADAIDKKGAP